MSMSAADNAFHIGMVVSVIAGSYKGKKGQILRSTTKSAKIRLLNTPSDQQPKKALSLKSLQHISEADAAKALKDEKSKRDSERTALQTEIDVLLAHVNAHRERVQLVLLGEGNLSFSEALWTILTNRYLEVYSRKLSADAIQLICTVYVSEKDLELVHNAKRRAEKLKKAGHVVLYNVDCTTMANNVELRRNISKVHWTIFNFPHTGENHIGNGNYGKNLKKLIDGYVQEAKLILHKAAASRIIVSYNWSYSAMFGHGDFQVRNSVRSIWTCDFDADEKFKIAGYEHKKTNKGGVAAPHEQPTMLAYGLRLQDLAEQQGLPSQRNDAVTIANKNMSLAKQSLILSTVKTVKNGPPSVYPKVEEIKKKVKIIQLLSKPGEQRLR